MPLRNEEASVIALLESIARQDRPPDEVVVVDAGSEDRTAALVSSFAAPTPLSLVAAGPLYPGSARNAGVKAATHEWLAFTDGGVRLASSWLGELLSVAGESSADVVFGSFEPVTDSLFRRCAAVAYVPGPGASGARGPSVASMALSRAAFEQAGGFPPYRAAEDLIFIERLLALPLRVAHAPRATVYWEIAPGAAATLRRFALYSEHNLRAGRARHWHFGILRHYVTMAVLAAALALTGAGAWSLAVYPAWQLARAARSAWHKRRAFAFRVGAGHALGAAAVLCVLDAATLVGALRWLGQGRPRTP